MTRRHGSWLAALTLTLAACVDVPEPADPVDAGPADRGPDSAALDAAPDAAPDADPPDRSPPDQGSPDQSPVDATPPVDAAPPADAGPDAGPPVRTCLEPLDGLRGEGDPCLEVWAAASLDAARVYAAGGTIAGDDGPRVVITGGYAPSNGALEADARSWIYDPRLDTWSPGPLMSDPRWGHAAAVSDGGDLFVAGGAAGIGDDGDWQALDTAERLGPGGWVDVPGRLGTPRALATAVPLARDRIAVLGGRETYDTRATRRGDTIAVEGVTDLQMVLVRGRARAAAALLPDGRLLIAGGLGDDNIVEPIPELGQDDAAAFEDLDAPLIGGIEAAMAPLSDGALLVGGAGADGPARQTDAWRFSEAFDRFVSLPPMATSRFRPTVSAIGPPGGDWRLVAGGDGRGVVELYDPVGDRLHAFLLPAPFDHGRGLHVAAVFEVDGEQQVIVVGGQRDPSGDTPQDPITTVLRFRLTPPPPPAAEPDPLPDGCLPVEGGVPDQSPCLRVRRGPPLPEALTEVGADRTPDGRLVVAGGLDPQQAPGYVSSGTYSLDVSGRIWRRGSSLTTPRWGHLLTTSNVWYAPDLFVYGGATDWGRDQAYTATDRAERWPAAGLGWVALPDRLAAPRVDGAAARPGAWGYVVTFGGRAASDGAALDSGDVVRGPVVNSEVNTPNAARIDAAACPLGPSVVIFGGHADGVVLGSVEVRPSPEVPWVPTANGQPRTEATCVGGASTVDFIGGRDRLGALPTRTWQRLTKTNEGYIIANLSDISRARARPTISPIGLGENDSAAWLVVGGEDPGDRAAPTVDLIFPRLPDGSQRAYTVLLPEGVGLRRGHRAVSREIGPAAGEALLERDVVVIGGLGPDGGPLDDVLIFSLDAFDPPGGLGPVGPGID